MTQPYTFPGGGNPPEYHDDPAPAEHKPHLHDYEDVWEENDVSVIDAAATPEAASTPADTEGDRVE
jgi:hypothetical protein